jgi:hypothetical protein
MAGSEDGKKGYAKSKDSLQAHVEAQKKAAREAYEDNPKICPTCNRVLPYEERYKKFCNQSCSASYNNRGVTRHSTHPGDCANCGKRKEKRHNKYCNECIGANVYSSKITVLEEAKSDLKRRTILLELRGRRCELCGITEWRGKPAPIELDHIDGNPDNNTSENLRLICPNCHAQTDTYKGKGVTSGHDSKRKTMRRQRYKDGKSY